MDLNQLMNDPEVMSLLREPGMLQQMQELMSNPERIPEMMAENPSLARLVQRFGAGGGGGHGGGMPGMGGGSQQHPEPLQIKRQNEMSMLLDQSEASGLPVIVDYFATWCGPCKMIAPTFAALAAEYKGQVVFVRVNVDDCDASVKSGITSMPTFRSYLGHENLDEFKGASEGQLRNMVTDALQRAEDRKAQAAAKRFKHFPLRANEQVYYKDFSPATASKVIAKVNEIVSTWDTVTFGPGPWFAQGFATNDAFCDAVASLVSVIQPTKASSPTGTAAVAAAADDDVKSPSSSVEALTQIQRSALATLLLDFKGANATPGVHFARWLVLTAAGSDALTKPLREDGPTGVAALTAILERRDHLMSSHLAARGLCNFFARYKTAQFMITQSETVIPAVTALLFKEPSVDHVISHCFGVLINYAIAVTEGVSRDPQELYQTKLMLLMQLIDAVTPTLLQGGRGALYRAFAVIGTLLLSDPSLLEIVMSLDWTPENWITLAGVAADPNSKEAAAELRRILDKTN